METVPVTDRLTGQRLSDLIEERQTERVTHRVGEDQAVFNVRLDRETGRPSCHTLGSLLKVADQKVQVNTARSARASERARSRPPSESRRGHLRTSSWPRTDVKT